MKLISAVLVVLCAAVLAAAGLIYFGVVDMGADVPHWPLVENTIKSMRERSIAVRIAGIQPPALEDPDLIAEGAEHYGAMCAGCHLAPGKQDTAIRKGLYPQPPNLAEPGRNANVSANVASESPEERTRRTVRQFWIVKHGIKGSGMPAWGATHDDKSIWALVAFVQKLPSMTPDDYAKLTMSAGAHHDEHDHDHMHDDDAGGNPESMEQDHHVHSDAGAEHDETAAHHHD